MSVFTLLSEKKNLLHEKILFPGLLLPTDPAREELETLVYIYHTFFKPNYVVTKK